MLTLELFRFIHFIGLAFGLGGATIANIISVRAEKDNEVGLVYGKIISPISKIIWLGLILLIISGIALSFYIKWPINREILIIKHILVIWIVIIGILIAFFSKKLKNISLQPASKSEKKSFKSLIIKKLIRKISLTNLLLWYIVTFLSFFV